MTKVIYIRHFFPEFHGDLFIVGSLTLMFTDQEKS